MVFGGLKEVWIKNSHFHRCIVQQTIHDGKARNLYAKQKSNKSLISQFIQLQI